MAHANKVTAYPLTVLVGGQSFRAAQRKRDIAIASRSVSGQAMPLGDVTVGGNNWRQIYAEDFLTDVPVGSFPGPSYPNLYPYTEGSPDTAAKTVGADSIYSNDTVVSVFNSVLRKNLHLNGTTACGAAIQVFTPEENARTPTPYLFNRYSIRWRAQAIANWHMAWLTWPLSDIWPGDGEIDWVECDLDGGIEVFMHRQGASSGSDQDNFSSGIVAGDTGWHTSTLEWISGTDCRYYLDGVMFGQSTSRVPNTPMDMIIQTERGYTLANPPSTSALIEIDWFVMYDLV